MSDINAAEGQMTVAGVAAIAEARLVSDALKIARDPSADPDRIRTALEKLEPEDQLRLSDRIADALRREGTRSGSYETLERVSGYLPGQGALGRGALEQEIAQNRTVGDLPLFAPAQLSPDAQTVQQAIARVLDDRKPGNQAAIDDLKAHVGQALSDRERLDGPVVLSSEIRIVAGKPPGLHDLAQFEGMVKQVQELRPGYEDRITEAQALEVRQSLEGQIGSAKTLRDLQKLYSEEDVGRSIAAVAKHPEQERLLTEMMATTEARLLTEQRGLNIPKPPPLTPSGSETPAIELTRRGDNGAPSTPASPSFVPRNYVAQERDGERLYYQAEDGRLAIRSDEQRIQGVMRDARTIGAMLDIAASRGWDDVQIKGDRDIARDTWIEATARGMKAEGYAPTREDRHEASQRRLERQQRGIETPLPAQAPPPPKVSYPIPEMRL